MTARGVRLRVTAAGLAVLALLGLQLSLGAVSASAEASQIAFVTPSPVQTAFGGNWNVRIGTAYTFQPSVPIPPDQASVDVYLTGVEGIFATKLPIQPDGSVYVSQSAASTLPPGEYQMTAVLVPVPGSFVEGSQTTSPLVLSVSSYSVDADISVDDAGVAVEEPVIEARLSGQFVETTEAVPAGTWAFSVTGGGETVLDTEVAQDAGETDALRYAITAKLEKGVEYEVSATFTPVEALAAGLEVSQPSSVTFRTPSGSIADPIPYPLWLLIVTCVVPLALAIAVIVLTVQLGSRRAAAATGPDDTTPSAGVAPASNPTPPGDSPVAGPGEWDPFASLQDAPQQYPPTQVLPPATPDQAPTTPFQPPEEPRSWSLADETPPEEPR